MSAAGVLLSEIRHCCAGDIFIASSTFRQHTPGYVFTTRSRGSGYYKDAKQDRDVSEQNDVKSRDQPSADAENKACLPHDLRVYHVLKPRLLSSIAAEKLD